MKPYIGGGFGNKQEVLYEPLNAWLTTPVGGRAVKLDVSREGPFQNTRSATPSALRWRPRWPTICAVMARSVRAVSNQGFTPPTATRLWPTPSPASVSSTPDALAHHTRAYTVYTNLPAPGAMRGYGIHRGFRDRVLHGGHGPPDGLGPP